MMSFDLASVQNVIIHKIDVLLLQADQLLLLLAIPVAFNRVRIHMETVVYEPCITWVNSISLHHLLQVHSVLL